MTKFAIISDTHHHNWSAFSRPLETGVNDRLQVILDETKRCAEELAKIGGKTIYHGGDLFHVRGSVTPSVFVPTRDVYADIFARLHIGFEVNGGNHDFEHRHSTRLGNAVEAMVCGHVEAVSEPVVIEDDSSRIFVVPWHDKVSDLKRTLEDWAAGHNAGKTDDLIIHAPIDGVISGLPDHGLTADYLAKLGFRRVWAGHYHNAKDFGNGVYSIGALTHQTWSDVGSKAGFWIVDGDTVTWHESKAPKFIDLTRSMTKEDIERAVPGNYVRAKMVSPKPAEVKKLREVMEKMGARGIRIDVVKEPTRVRAAGITVKAGATVEQSIADFVKGMGLPNEQEVTIEAQRILAEAA